VNFRRCGLPSAEIFYHFSPGPVTNGGVVGDGGQFSLLFPFLTGFGAVFENRGGGGHPAAKLKTFFKGPAAEGRFPYGTGAAKLLELTRGQGKTPPPLLWGELPFPGPMVRLKKRLYQQFFIRAPMGGTFRGRLETLTLFFPLFPLVYFPAWKNQKKITVRLI